MNLHPHLISCLKSRMDIVRMTKVQENTIPVLLEGDDALVKSCTGSGKTLAYAIPIIQKFQEMEPKIKRSDGVHALVITPTRELAIQSYETFSTLTKAFTWIVPGYLIGGEKKKSEKARLRKGINILICTPGRLLDHLDKTSCLSLEKISWLVIDEADKLLEEGFKDSVRRILSKCNKERNSVLLSATLTKEVENLADMSLSDPKRIDVASGMNPTHFEDFAIPSNLKQFLVVVPSKLRLASLSGFIIDNCMKSSMKALIFMSSQNTVDFHYNLFTGVLAPLLLNKGHKCKFFRLQGSMKQEERTEIFNIFKKEKEGVLLCTDVAARGLDLPYIDWIVQYSAPSSPEIYVHRIGRTARIGKRGNSLLFLLPSEAKFSHLLAEHRINFEEVTTDKFLQPLLLISDLFNFRSKVTAEDCATALQTRYEKEVHEEKELHACAKDAFASYIQSYASYPKGLRHVLPFKALHLGHVAKSFCLREAPSNLRGSVPPKKHNGKRSGFDRSSEKSKPMKRKFQATVSEFDSGLSFISSGSGQQKKKRKKN
ncbi:ATP-dependent DNA helicase DDX31 isoform X2 [Parasteatoda tepidariorum]|nr:probable ATP-dependent RNA helicase DDX31 isoform X2 [Parasteatoda tepidariorum]XP_042902623.1 probable ATP-dependent RNA helicase DDX31 isoform X2 [Parasteatoda tepidariorum]